MPHIRAGAAMRAMANVSAILAVAGTPSLAGPMQFLDKWGSFGTGSGQFDEPTGIAAGPTGNIYVADRHNHRIQVFSSAGAFVTAWGDSGTGNGQFDTPQDVAVDANGDVYVVDELNSRIQVFSSTGTYLRQWGTFGVDDGQFKGPRGIAVDESLHVFVSENGLPNKRVQKFTSTGTFLTKWGTLGTADGQFQSPRGLGIDADGFVLVVDAVSNRVQRFTTMGNFVSKWGSSGSGNGQFQLPTGIDCAPGKVFVADQGNHRIQVFALDGTFLEAFGSFCSLPGGTGCVDPDGGGSLEAGDGQFNFPLGVAADASGNVFVTDTQNDRVEKLGSPATSGTGPNVSTLGEVTFFPNPTRGATWLHVGLDPGGSSLSGQMHVRARIYDGQGRLVREFFDGILPAGSHALRWDGESHQGTAVPPGVYFLDVQVDGQRWHPAKLVRLP